MYLRSLFLYLILEGVKTEVPYTTTINVPVIYNPTNSSSESPVKWINKDKHTRRQWNPLGYFSRMPQSTNPNFNGQMQTNLEVSPLPMFNKITTNNTMVHNYVISSHAADYHHNLNNLMNLPSNPSAKPSNMMNWNKAESNSSNWKIINTTPSQKPLDNADLNTPANWSNMQNTQVTAQNWNNGQNVNPWRNEPLGPNWQNSNPWQNGYNGPNAKIWPNDNNGPNEPYWQNGINGLIGTNWQSGPNEQMWRNEPNVGSNWQNGNNGPIGNQLQNGNQLKTGNDESENRWSTTVRISTGMPPHMTVPTNTNEVPIINLIQDPQRYHNICEMYVKNLLRIWKILSQFLSTDEHNVKIQQLPNLFNLLSIYIKIMTENVDSEKGKDLRNAALLLLNKDQANVTENFSKPAVLKTKWDFLRTSNMPVRVAVPGDAPDGLVVSTPMPKSKCEEMGLQLLTETFKKLYQEYMRHLIECEETQKMKLLIARNKY